MGILNLITNYSEHTIQLYFSFFSLDLYTTVSVFMQYNFISDIFMPSLWWCPLNIILSIVIDKFLTCRYGSAGPRILLAFRICSHSRGWPVRLLLWSQWRHRSEIQSFPFSLVANQNQRVSAEKNELIPFIFKYYVFSCFVWDIQQNSKSGKNNINLVTECYISVLSKCRL